MSERTSNEIGSARILCCVECGRLWLDPRERWRVYLTDDDAPDAVPYCADCAAYEFGP